jgi:uncharacterized protein (TIGR00290 family)
MNDVPFFCSWSGGKDAYLALQRAVQQGGRCAALLCMLHEDGARSRGHGLPLTFLAAQAAALGVPLITRATTWDGYEQAFTAALAELRTLGIADGVFGDIDLLPHREWVERVCHGQSFSSHLPLWQEPRRALIDELLASDVSATVVAVDAKRLDASFLGRRVTPELVVDLEAVGADACGEEGEYHTAVTAAPLFAAPVSLAWQGFVEHDGHYVLNFVSAEASS